MDAARLDAMQPKPAARHAAVAQHEATSEPAHEPIIAIGAERSAPMLLEEAGVQTCCLDEPSTCGTTRFCYENCVFFGQTPATTRHKARGS